MEEEALADELETLARDMDAMSKLGLPEAAGAAPFRAAMLDRVRGALSRARGARLTGVSLDAEAPLGPGVPVPDSEEAVEAAVEAADRLAAEALAEAREAAAKATPGVTMEADGADDASDDDLLSSSIL